MKTNYSVGGTLATCTWRPVTYHLDFDSEAELMKWVEGAKNNPCYDTITIKVNGKKHKIK